MKVILQEDVQNLGAVGDVVTVADGFGRNFLLPRKFAVLADEKNTNRLAHQKREAAARQSRALAEAKVFADKLAAVSISVKRQAAAEDKIFGSVTSADIAEALAAEGIVVDRKLIHLQEPIRNIGVFNVPVKVHKSVEAQVKVYVIRG